MRSALEERLKRVAREEGVDLQRLRRQVAFDRFLARLFPGAGAEWILKGGYAMELRFQTARATRDLDFTMRTAQSSSGDGLVKQLQDVGAKDAGDFFRYRIGDAMMDLDGAPYGGARYPVESIMGGRTFVKFHLDVGVAIFSFERLRILQPNLDGEIRCSGLAIRIDPVLGGQLEQVVVVFGRSEMLDEVQPLDEFGRHLLIGFGEDASQCRQIDLATVRRWEGEPSHLEKVPERLKEQGKDSRLKSLQSVRLGKALQFQRHLDTPLWDTASGGGRREPEESRARADRKQIQI